jgi:hypothetical protein
MSLALNVKKLNELVEQKRLVDGIEAFYADDVAMVESGGQPMIGKDANRAREEAFQRGLRTWEAKLLASAVDETRGTALNQWSIDFEHEEWGAGTLRQVAVQQWRDGRIVHEAFYKI